MRSTPPQPARSNRRPVEPAVPPRSLSTLNDDGSRHWLTPRLSPGRFLTRRRAVAWFLLALYTLIPFLTIGGKPVLLLDVATRHFTILGRTFLPTDTLVLALFMVGLFLSIFMATAITGRVWCGWACPQTVYMEFVFRPIERFFEGAPGKAKKSWQATGLARVGKYLAYLVICGHLANTFLAYFVGAETVYHWTLQPPYAHPVGFTIVAVTTALMLFDFGFFREQLCLVACPYGRFQSVMLDPQSLIISYDRARGEPRTRRGAPKPTVSLPVLDTAPAAAPELGDCVDCRMCVTTCPTGIDIRDGLQMECVNCAQCIDACDTVMAKLARPKGLIRYTSQASLAGVPRRFIRPRTVIYSAILIIIGTALTTLLLTSDPADIRILRARGAPFTTLPEGLVANTIQVKIVNRTEAAVSYTISIDNPVTGVALRCDDNPATLAPGESRAIPAVIVAPPATFTNGEQVIHLHISDGKQFQKLVNHRMVGPYSTPTSTPAPTAAPGGNP